MKKATYIWAVTMAGLMGASAIAASAHAQPGIYVRNITHAGTGCAAGSLDVELRDEGAVLALGFDDFTASAGRGEPLSNSRKACQLLIDIVKPDGLQFRLRSVAFEGYYSLGYSASAQIKTTTYFQGQSAQATSTVDLFGPDSDYIADQADFNGGVWSPCHTNRALNIKISAAVRAYSNASGEVTLLGPLGVDPSTIRLEWRRCN